MQIIHFLTQFLVISAQNQTDVKTVVGTGAAALFSAIILKKAIKKAQKKAKYSSIDDDLKTVLLILGAVILALIVLALLGITIKIILGVAVLAALAFLVWYLIEGKDVL